MIGRFVPVIKWRGPDQKVYLTFDDGPDEDVTPRILHLLQSLEISATFFLVGQKVERHRDIAVQIKKLGHTIGNHSYSHCSLLGKSQDRIVAELAVTDAIIKEITGSKPRYFRPPYGRFGLNLLRLLTRTRHEMVLWSTSCRDYGRKASSQFIRRRMMKIEKGGEIVLLHDGHPNSYLTLRALEESLGLLKNRGLAFSALPEGANAVC